MQTRRKFAPTLMIAVLLVVAAATGCDSDKGAIPDSADARLQQSTETLPSDTSFVYTISDLAEFRDKASDSRKTIERLFPLERMLTRLENTSAGSKFFDDEGLQIFEKKFWKESGIAPDSAFSLGMVDYNTVLVTYVADQKKFEKDLLGDLETDAEPTSETIADHQVKSVETDKGEALWNYRGKLATVVFPDGNDAAPEGAETPSTATTFERLVGTQKGEALYATSGFEKFRDAAGDRSALGYAHLTPHIKRGMLEGNDTDVGETYAQNLEKSLDGFGFLLETEQNRIRPRIWIGLTEDGQKHFERLFSSPVTAEWANYATTDTLIGLRSAGNWKNFWESITSTMPEAERKKMESNFEQAKSQLGIDLQKDVIDNLDGQAGLLVYGIGGKATRQVIGNPAAIVENLEAMYLMKFSDAEMLDKLAEKGAALSQENITRRPVEVDGEETDVQAIDLTIPEGGLASMLLQNANADSMAGSEAPIRFYTHDETLALATTAIDESRIHQMLTGADGAESITESSTLDLGASFADKDQMSGLYLNFVRFREIFGDQIPPVRAIQKPVEALQEALLATEQADQGAWLDLTIDLVPAAENQESSGE